MSAPASAGGPRRSYGLTAEPGVWERRFIAAPPQLDAVVQLYRQLGFEVRLDRVTQDELDDHCNDCHLALHLFRAIYVRRPAP